MSTDEERFDPESILSGHSKDYLIKILAVFSDTDVQTAIRTFQNLDKNSIVRALMTTYNGRASAFALHLRQIESCSLNSLKELLLDEDGMSATIVDNIKNKKDWLLFAYRQDFEDRIGAFVVRSQISPTSLFKEYIVDGKLKRFSADSLKNNILTNIRRFNENSLRKFFWRFPPTFADAGDSSVFNITIYVEGKEQTVRTFRFRNKEDLSEEEKYEVQTIRFRSVGKKTITLVIKDDKYLLNTNMNLDRDVSILQEVMNPMFEKGYVIRPVTYAAHAALVRSRKTESTDPSKATEQIIESFDELKAKKVEEIGENDAIPKEKKKSLISIIDQVTIAGIASGNVPEYSTESFDWTFKNVESAMRLPGSREMAGALLSISKNHTLKFNFQSTRITLENGELKRSKKLSPHEDEAIRILFSGDEDEKN